MGASDDDRAIRDLAARYSDAMICRDASAAAATYAEDGVLHAFDEEPLVGRDAIEANFAAVLGKYEFIFQMTHQGFVSPDGDTATARWHLSEIARTPDGRGTQFLGTYSDRLRRTPDGWRFAHRRLTGVYVGRIELPGKHFDGSLPAWPG